MHYLATSYIYTLSLHDALPIYSTSFMNFFDTIILPHALGSKHTVKLEDRSFELFTLSKPNIFDGVKLDKGSKSLTDRKSTRLNSSHQIISYAVFCLKKTTH